MALSPHSTPALTAVPERSSQEEGLRVEDSGLRDLGLGFEAGSEHKDDSTR